MTTNDDDTFNETLTCTNGELLVMLGQVFDIDPADICRWGIVLTSHVTTEAPGTHDIRVASNCQDSDIPRLLRMGIMVLS